jgi:hypothetical protein
MTPFKAWHGRKSRVSHLKVFGCTASVKLVGPNLTKLSDRSRKMIFIGYETGTKGYRFYDPNTAKLVVSWDVIFSESEPWRWNNTDGSDTQLSDTFTVEYEFAEPNPTTEMARGIPVEENAQQGPADQGDAPNSPAPSPQTPHTPNTLQNQGGGNHPNSAPNSAETEEGPVRFRTLADMFDSTDEITDFEYSGVCMLAADEPTNVEQALGENCWKEAMEIEMQSNL